MADTTSQFTVSDSLRSGFARVLASIMRGIETNAHIRSRRDRIVALEARSDAELAQMGLNREDIAHHVFRDLYYV